MCGENRDFKQILNLGSPLYPSPIRAKFGIRDDTHGTLLAQCSFDRYVMSLLRGEIPPHYQINCSNFQIWGSCAPFSLIRVKFGVQQYTSRFLFLAKFCLDCFILERSRLASRRLTDRDLRLRGRPPDPVVRAGRSFRYQWHCS